MFGFLGGGDGKPKEVKKTWDGRTYNAGEELMPGVTPGEIFQNKEGKEGQEPPKRHTVFGAGSMVSKEMRKSLAAKDPSIRVRFVNDKYIPKQLFESDETWKVDYMNKDAVDYIISGSTHVYLLNEFEYATRVWKDKWPKFMKLVVDSCIKHKAKLIFLDNDMVYAESAVGNQTEDSPVDPPSKKGKVRKECCDIIMDAIKAGKLTAMIVRAAELYGPWFKEKHTKLMVMIYKRLWVGGVAEWPFTVCKKQTFTYAPDCGKALAALALTNDCYNQVWHAPTYTEKTYNACEWCIIFADALGIKHSSPAPGSGVGPLARHGDDVPEDERVLPDDTDEVKKAKEEKAKARQEKVEKDREERKKKLAAKAKDDPDGEPEELAVTVLYENFVYLQSFLSGFMSEIEDTKYLNTNDHVFKSTKFEGRFPDIKPTKPEDACAEIVLIEGTHMKLQAEGKTPGAPVPATIQKLPPAPKGSANPPPAPK